MVDLYNDGNSRDIRWASRGERTSVARAVVQQGGVRVDDQRFVYADECPRCGQLLLDEREALAVNAANLDFDIDFITARSSSFYTGALLVVRRPA
jgi:hypothetical protein